MYIVTILGLNNYILFIIAKGVVEVAGKTLNPQSRHAHPKDREGTAFFFRFFFWNVLWAGSESSEPVDLEPGLGAYDVI